MSPFSAKIYVAISKLKCYSTRDLYLSIEFYFTHIVLNILLHLVGTRWCSWLRHCAIGRKVAGSIPYGVISSFFFSERTVALVLTQPLREISTSNS
jgi:hypothetical protein